MDQICEAKEKVMAGKKLERKEAFFLCDAPLEELCQAADEIRRHFCGNTFDMCAIINGKSGRCSEDCKYCAQSSHYHTGTKQYPLVGKETVLEDAALHRKKGVPRYSIVTSGRKLSDQEVEEMCGTIRSLTEKEKGLKICVSFGLLNREQFEKLKQAGVVRIHNNLETSAENFPNVCTTHSFTDKLQAIQAAKEAGLEVCSGGIMGLGETWEDRIDLACTLRELHIKSVPVNMLNPIPGTPYEKNPRLTEEEMRRICAVFRFLLPDAYIRLAGGRGLLKDKGRACFLSGANAMITGDMLTTAGYTVESDRAMLKELGYEIIGAEV